MYVHKTVLLNECIEGLNIKEDGIYIDATLGGAGHSALILEYLGANGKLICFDQDQLAIENAKERFGNDQRVLLIKANFKFLKAKLTEYGIEKIDGILFDLGVSSMQIDQRERGFSYMQDAKLDMRMDETGELTAYQVINTYEQAKLVEIMQKYGEEKFAVVIAKNIIEQRAKAPIETTMQLNEIIRKSYGAKHLYRLTGHPSKKVFQALRIAVNDELDVFDVAVNDVFEFMKPGGRICVITFHSLEDRICKYNFKKFSEVSSDFKTLPVIPDEYLPKGKIINRKPILPTDHELETNTRSRSAKLRILERI